MEFFSLTETMIECYGQVGLVFGGIAWIVWRFDKQLEFHRQDRNNWLADSERLTGKMINSLNANTAILSEVVTILKERR